MKDRFKHYKSTVVGGNIVLKNTQGQVIAPDDIQGNTIIVEQTTGGVPANSLKPTKSGQVLSYATGDDGDIRFGRDTDFYTLSWNNPFGNTNRFTDISGGQVFANGIGIDWTTYDMNSGEVSGFLISTDSNKTIGDSWDGWMAGSPYSDKLGDYNDFILCNVRQMHQLMEFGLVYPLDYPPFNHQNIGLEDEVWTSSSDRSLVNYRMIMAGRHVLGSRAAATSDKKAMLWRQFTLTELGL